MFKISYELKITRAHGNNYEKLYNPIINRNDAGVDIYFPEDIFFEPKSQVKVGLGIHCSIIKKSIISLPSGGGSTLLEPCSFFLMPRSSISKTPLRLSNSIGLIDAGYRGELQAPLDNISDENYLVKAGTRLFQIVNPDLSTFSSINIVDKLSETDRGEGGFGSTGD